MRGLNRLRMQVLLSRKELADRVGVTRQTLSLWENGKAMPTVEHIRKLVEVLGVDANTVLSALEEVQEGDRAALVAVAC